MGKEVKERILQLQQQFTYTREQMLEVVKLGMYPLTSEPALVHPLKTSTVKLRDNGAIDIFVGNDNGIRVDPNDRNIQVFSNQWRSRIYDEKTQIMHNRELFIGNREEVVIKGDIARSSYGHCDEFVKKKWHMTSTRKIVLQAPYIELNGTVVVNKRKVLTEDAIVEIPDDMERDAEDIEGVDLYE